MFCQTARQSFGWVISVAFKETVSRKKDTTRGKHTTGFILEEARTKCGGQQYLEEAMAGGRVIVVNDM